MCVCGRAATHDPRVNEFLVECHYCSTWYHGRCIHVNEVDAMEIVKLACPPCTKQGHTTVKYQDTAPMVDMDDISYAPLPMQRHRFDPSYSHAHGSSSSYGFGSYYKKNTELFRRTLRAAVFARSGVRTIAPHDFPPTYFKFHALDEPLLITDANWSVAGLTRALPVIGLQDVSALLTNTASIVRGLDVGSQESFKLSATGWQTRLSHPAADAPLTAQFRVLETVFRHEVSPPLAVNEIDWNYLLPNASGATNREANPECYGTLCGPGAFFDFTVAPDCKATWLAVSNGDVDVFLIEPTATHVELFREWKTDAKMPFSTVFLADRVDRCLKTSVKSGATLLVPSGWIYALFTEHGGSFFTGYFAHTLNLPTHLDVWQRLEGGDARFARHWQESSFTHGWALQHPSPAVAPAPPFNAQVWSLVCHYIHEFSHIDVLLRVGSLERDALRRSLQLLRQWSASPRAIERVDNVSWLPSSLQDGASLVDQLEQALMAHASEASPVATRGSSGSDANYLYAGTATSDDEMWSGAAANGGVSSAFSSNSSNSYHQESVVSTANHNSGLWEYQSQYGGGSSAAHSHAGMDPLAHGHGAHGGNSSPYYHQDHLSADGQFSSALHYGAAGGGAGHSFGGYMDPSDGGAAHLGLGGHPLMDLSGGLLHDVHMRHRASCHRCGNLRKKNVRCSKCPHIFCQKCAEKMVEEHSDTVFVDGCPVCKELCCCGKNRTLMCTRKFHCYKKCPSTKRQTN